MDIILKPALDFVLAIFSLYRWAIIIYVVLNLLETFKIINPYSPVVYKIHNFLFSIVEPALGAIRRVIPIFAGIDLSPLILILSITFIEGVLSQFFIRFLL